MRNDIDQMKEKLQTLKPEKSILRERSMLTRREFKNV